ncbi:MAG: hypothetical protein COA94_04795 [Rickettsiales bacterium]|nr:MAG: hypothetical protein COA94_04795 [Rickettsiales bacterium]
MTVFTRTWNPAYEALPPDTENAKNGAERINETKVDTRERFEVDHSQAGDVDDGMHKKVTFVDPLGAKPLQLNDETYLYSKDVDGSAELFFEDEAGNETQLTAVGKMVIDLVYPVGAIYASASSTSPDTLFGGTWTALADKQTLVQQGTYAAGTSGGSSVAVNVDHTHSDTFSLSSDGAHAHNVRYSSASLGGSSALTGLQSSSATGNTASSAAISNGSHSHTMSGGVSSAGVSGTDANMPPYLSVHMWQRTA